MTPEQVALLDRIWHVAGWTMAHYLWVGLLIGLVATVVRRALVRTEPQVRYACSLLAFGLLVAAPGVIAWLLLPTASPIALSPRPNAPVSNWVLAESSVENHSLVESAPAESTSPPIVLPTMPPQQVQSISPSLVPSPLHAAALPADNESGESFKRLLTVGVQLAPWVWIVGAPLMLLLLLTGMVGGERLRRQSEPVGDATVTRALKRLRAKLGIGREVGVAVCQRVAQPVLVGVVRPLILLPPAALAGWSPEQLEMVLLHELAHVRRWDNLVNLVQRLAESALFFHPMVWIVSRQLRHDREECCDAIVVRHTGQPAAYAEVLVSVAAGQRATHELTTGPAMAMARSPLGSRVRRILKLEEEKMFVSRRGMLFGFAFAVAVTAALVWMPAKPQAADPVDSSADNRADNSAPSTPSADDNYGFGLAQSERAPDEAYGGGMGAEFGEPAGEEFEGEPREEFTDAPDANNRFQQPPRARGFGGGRSGRGGQRNLRPAASGMASEVPQADAPLLLSFEDQKIADQAYRVLGVELEPADKEDLARARKLGFRGALKVVDINYDSSQQVNAAPSGRGASRGGQSRKPPMLLMPDDLLVGLHSWPTTSLGALSTVLSRPDLERLNPLKFYVVRRVQARQASASRLVENGFAEGEMGYGGGYGEMGSGIRERSRPVMEDRIVRGRVYVSLASAPQVSDRKAPSRGPIEYAAPRPDLPPRAATGPALNVPNADLNRLDPLVRYPTPPSAQAPSQKPTRAGARNNPVASPWQQQVLQQPTAPVAPTSSPPQAMYDGKPFSHWKTLWRTELKTENRLECVRALGAFGRQPALAKEAAETILDVAGEYDFKSWASDTPEGKLLNSILSLLRSGKISTGPAVWLESLLARYEEEPDRWRWLAYHLLRQSEFTREEDVDRLTDIALDHSDATLRRAALEAVCISTGGGQPEGRRLELLREVLKSDDYDLVHLATTKLAHRNAEGDYQLLWVDELYPLLFHREQEIQKSVRRTLARLPQDEALQLTKRLLSELQTEGRELQAIYALAAIGDKAKSLAREPLLEMVDSNSPIALLFASAHAADQMAEWESSGFGRTKTAIGTMKLVDILVKSQFDGKPSREQRRAVLEEVERGVSLHRRNVK